MDVRSLQTTLTSIDEAGEKQLLTAETLYTYTQTVELTDDEGNATGEYATYYYYFGESDSNLLWCLSYR